jgi:hypothetical protein
MGTLRKRARYRIQLVQAQVGALLLRRASRKRKGLRDRLCSWLLARLVDSTDTNPDHFMRDELVDADVEFDPAELSSYQGRSSG